MPRGKRAETRPETIADNEVPQLSMTVDDPSKPEPRQRPERQSPSRPGSRISLQLDEAGRPDWERMRESNREETKKVLTAWLTDAKLQSDLGLSKPIIEVVTPASASALYDAIGRVEAVIAPKITGMPPDIAQMVFRYSDEEKQLLGGPTAVVINKWCPLWLTKFQEEIALAMLLTSITVAKFQLAKQLFDQRKTETTVRPNGVEHEGVAS